jgi:hypothetical protein
MSVSTTWTTKTKTKTIRTRNKTITTTVKTVVTTRVVEGDAERDGDTVEREGGARASVHLVDDRSEN